MSANLERRLAAALTAAGGALSTPPERLGAVVRRGRRRQAAARVASTVAVVAVLLVTIGGAAWLPTGLDRAPAGQTAPPPAEAEPVPVLPPDTTISVGTLPVVPGECPALGQLPEGEPRTAVVAVVPGVVDVEIQGAATVTLELVGDDGLRYVYTGLDGLIPGIADGERLMEGEQLGTVPPGGDELRLEVRTPDGDLVPLAGTRFEDC